MSRTIMPVVVVKTADSYWLMGRKAGKENWIFPGGRLEPGETLEECAKREVLEETGVDLCGTHLTLLGYFDGKPEWLIMAFECQLSGHAVPLSWQHKPAATPTVREPDIHDAWEWVESTGVRYRKTVPLTETEQHIVHKLLLGR